MRILNCRKLSMHALKLKCFNLTTCRLHSTFISLLFWNIILPPLKPLFVQLFLVRNAITMYTHTPRHISSKQIFAICERTNHFLYIEKATFECYFLLFIFHSLSLSLSFLSYPHNFRFLPFAPAGFKMCAL